MALGMTTPTVAIFTGPEGHLSISQAAAAYLSTRYNVETFFHQDNLFSVYRPMYQLLPGANKLPFLLSQSDTLVNEIHRIFKNRHHEKIQNFIEQHQPQVCLSTYFMFNASLTDQHQRGNCTFLNIIADPVTVHPLLISPQANNLVFDNTTADTCQGFVPDATYDPIGWLVRPDFQPVAAPHQVRKELGLETDMFTILVTAGSEGTTLIMKILPALLSLARPTQIMAACGSNSHLYRSISVLQKVVERTPSASKVVPLHFRPDIHRYMQAADLIVGKAGPNSIFEAVATETPFMAITHIAGQEDGNLDLIKKYQLGFVEENPIRAVKLLQDIVKHPAQLEKFTPHIKKLAQYNRQAGEKLISHVETTLRN
jgi:UDP-N-acetylglucosamine:LPS N-acetylglucosamine transferase